MAKYKVVVPTFRSWIHEKEDGTFEWKGGYDDNLGHPIDGYPNSKTFQNYFKAKAAYDSVEPLRDCYNYIIQPTFMKISS